MKTSAPKVFIGLPVYNAGPYLRQALASLVSQTYVNITILISDNHSTDTTREICIEYLNNNKNVSYVRHEENIGAIANFQFVLHSSTGDYFMWAADDDLWSPDYVSTMVEILEENRKSVTAFSYYNTRDLLTEAEQRYSVMSSSTNSHRVNALLRLASMHANVVYGLHRLDAAKKVNLEKFDCFDIYFCQKMAFLGSIEIEPRFLFTSGIKESLIGSVTGRNISRFTYLRRMCSLFSKEYGSFGILILIPLLFFQTARQALLPRLKLVGLTRKRNVS